MMLYTKYESFVPCSFRQIFFESFESILKNLFFLRLDQLMQPIKTIWIILVGDHPGTIPVEFGQIPISGSREEVV